MAAVAAVPAEAPAPAAIQGGAVRNAPVSSAFANLLQQGLGEVEASVGAAETAMRKLAAGKAVELHEVMISLEHARISVQTFIQVRNKLVESYQDVMRMQL